MSILLVSQADAMQTSMDSDFFEVDIEVQETQEDETTVNVEKINVAAVHGYYSTPCVRSLHPNPAAEYIERFIPPYYKAADEAYP